MDYDLWILLPIIAIVTLILTLGSGFNEAGWYDEFYNDKAKCEQSIPRDEVCVQVWTEKVNVPSYVLEEVK